jgi:hypothetical protein
MDTEPDEMDSFASIMPVTSFRKSMDPEIERDRGGETGQVGHLFNGKKNVDPRATNDIVPRIPILKRGKLFLFPPRASRNYSGKNRLSGYIPDKFRDFFSCIPLAEQVTLDGQL